MKAITAFHRLAAAAGAVAATLAMFVGLASLADYHYSRAATPEAMVTAESGCVSQGVPAAKKVPAAPARTKAIAAS